jgi:hypothetical protein
MDTILFKPTSKQELELLKAMAKKMGIKYSTLSIEDQLDMGLLKAMREGRTGKHVSRNNVMKILKG